MLRLALLRPFSRPLRCSMRMYVYFSPRIVYFFFCVQHQGGKKERLQVLRFYCIFVMIRGEGGRGQTKMDSMEQRAGKREKKSVCCQEIGLGGRLSLERRDWQVGIVVRCPCTYPRSTILCCMHVPNGPTRTNTTKRIEKDQRNEAGFNRAEMLYCFFPSIPLCALTKTIIITSVITLCMET